MHWRNPLGESYWRETMMEALSAIGSIGSAVAAIFSFIAFLYAIRIQREDSTNDVRPELLLLDWSIEDEEDSNDGLCTFVHAKRIKNVGRGPAFDIWCTPFASSQ